MKFCKECKKLHDGAETMCPQCRKKYIEISDINEPVQLCVVGGVERSAICGALRDAEIPFVEQQYGKMGVSNEIVTGYDAKLLNVAVLVPYSAIPKAYEIAVSLDLCDESFESIAQKAQADIDDYKKKLSDDKSGKMSNTKRTAVKVISAILFFILVALVVLGTDYVTELIKNLFGG